MLQSAIYSLSQPHPLADAVSLGRKLAKASSTGRGLGWGCSFAQIVSGWLADTSRKDFLRICAANPATTMPTD